MHSRLEYNHDTMTVTLRMESMRSSCEGSKAVEEHLHDSEGVQETITSVYDLQSLHG